MHGIMNYRWLFLLASMLLISSQLDAQITILNPSHGEVIDGATVDFEWSDNTAGDFELELANNPGFSPVIFSDTVIGQENWTISSLNPGTYYWRIRNISITDTTWSASYQFELINLNSYSSITFWLKPESGFIVSASNTVSTWNNAIGNNHATQVSSSSQPLLVTQGLNGKSYVSFDGANDHLNFLPVSDIFEAFIVCEHNTGSQNYTPVLGDGLQQPDFHGAVGTRLISTAFASPNIGNGSIRVNGVTQTFANTNKPTSFASISVSATDSVQSSAIARDRGFTSRSWDGSFVEVLLFNENLSLPEKLQIDNYLKWKYTPFPFLGKDTLACGESIELSVPADNAYSSITWSTGASNVDTITITQNGIYWVEVVSFDMVLRDTIVIDGIIPQPSISLSSNELICFGDSIQASYTPVAGFTHYWSNGDTSLTTAFKDSSQNMQVFHVDSNGCLASSDWYQLTVDSLSLQSTLGPDRNLCLGSIIELETSATGPFEYLWSTGDTSSTTSVPSFGVQDVWLSLSNSNNCVFTDTIQVNSLNLPAPTINFIADTVCLFDTTSLFDLSIPGVGDSIVTWEWVFESGDTLFDENPTYAFSSYNEEVRLTITTDSSCENSIARTIYNHRLPEASFLDFIECAQSDFSLQSNSTVASPDNIAQHTWNVNGQVLTGPAPSFNFPNAGFFDIQLIVETDKNCQDSITEQVEIYPALLPDFEAQQICIGDTTQFIETTPSFSVVSRNWNFGFFNQSSTAQDPTFYYPSTGIYPVTLRVENAIGCTSEITKTIEIRTLPELSFVTDNTCEQTSSTFIDASTTVNGTIVNQVWEIDGNQLIGDTVVYVFEEENSYPISLQVEDNFGCVNDSSAQIEIFALPSVNFNFTPNYGEAPIEINFTNLSSNGAVDYYWDFGDGIGNSIDINPNYTYNTNGNYTILLAGSTVEGCVDTVTKEIAIIPTELDLELSNFSIQKITLADGSTAYQPSVLLKNVGTRAIFNTELVLRVNNETAIAETWEGILPVGVSALYELENFALIKNTDLLDYICLEAILVNDNTEINLTNNKVCLIQRGEIQCSPIYPNPAQDIAYIDVVMENDGTATLEVFDLSGKLVLQGETLQLVEGYNQVAVSTKDLQAGKYILYLNYQEDITSFSLIISNR